MRWHREVRGRLGDPVERGIPVIPPRWRLPALVATTGLCVIVFLAAILYGVSHG